MKLLAVNISLPREVLYKDKMVSTGIFKTPVKTPVTVNTLNIEGDGQADLRVHGGESKAVMVYSYDNYTYWENELNRDDFETGQFGENFTVSGMLETEVCIGDQFQIGSCLFEVTQPRIPCFKLEMKMKEEGFAEKYLKNDRTGFYFRVLKEGVVNTGDKIEKVFQEPSGITVAMAKNILYFDKSNKEAIQTILGINALSPSWRKSFEKLI
ncbi:MOSC domain-containing protein [Flavobacteriaceae bacterium R38]|nr:MOSC domain-containing protein [Flavobacteriaceae bacterium R38]